MVTEAQAIAGFVPTLPIHLEIWEYMLERAVGPSNVVKAREIAEALGIRDNRENTLTRKIILQMINDGAPIVARCGYFVSTDADQLQQYAESLDARAAEVMKRRDSVLRIVDSLN